MRLEKPRVTEVPTELSAGDACLLEEIRQGSAAGWAQLVERYQGRLVAYARSKLRQRSDAEDLVQDTFVSFLRNLGSFRGQASIETFLFTILRRRVLDTYRGPRANLCLLQDTLQATGDSDAVSSIDIAGSDPTASWYARRNETHDRQGAALAAALTELINDYKTAGSFRDLQIIEMLFYCQLRNKDIAAQTGVSENHIAVIKHRAIHQIAERVAQELSATEQWEPPDALLTEIWQEQRLSCPKRSTVGAYLLGTLEPDWWDYVAFHLDKLGCRFCRANLDDLKQQTADEGRRAMRDKIMQSTVGFLRKP